jgi:putative transcriptional regulator
VKNRLKVLRAERNWSQAQLADALSVSRQTINAIETGKYDPSLPLALKIGRLFQQPVEAIFLLEEQPAKRLAIGRALVWPPARTTGTPLTSTAAMPSGYWCGCS